MDMTSNDPYPDPYGAAEPQYGEAADLRHWHSSHLASPRCAEESLGFNLSARLYSASASFHCHCS